jgi:hypothetical protein
MPKIKTSNKTRLDRMYTVDEVTDCHNFTGAINNIGYGLFRYHGEDSSKMISASKASYLTYNGPIPDKHMVMHTCNNKKCVNPDHLVAVTRKEMVEQKLRDFNITFGTQTGSKMPTKECPHCGKVDPINTYARYHGDRCKHYKRA